MTPRTRRLIVSAGMLVMAAILTALLAADEETPSTSTIAGAIAARPAATHRVLAAETAFAAIAQRPLFLPSRRPEPEAPPPPAVVERPAQPAAPPALSATLVGVLISPTGRAAIVRLADGKSATIPEGETLQGWTLKQVSPDGVLFLSGSTSIDLAFPTHQAAPASGAAADQSLAAVAARRRR
jgi:type II secretory pathway component PulC